MLSIPILRRIHAAVVVQYQGTSNEDTGKKNRWKRRENRERKAIVGGVLKRSFNPKKKKTGKKRNEAQDRVF